VKSIFHIKDLSIDSLVFQLSTRFTNTNMWDFEMSQRDEKTSQSADSLKVCRKSRALFEMWHVSSQQMH